MCISYNKKYEGIRDEGTLRALEAIDRLDKDGSEFWQQQRESIIKSGKERDKLAIFCERNDKGKEYEKNKDLENAIKQYEENIADSRVNTITSLPYYRLMVIYHRLKDYQNAKRIIEKAIQLGVDENGEYQKRLEKLLSKINNV